MSLASARKALDDTVHSPVRFTLMSALASVDQADYQTLKEALDVSYALLSKHAAILEQAGYVRITKQFVGRTPRTDLALTRAGRAAYAAHLAALDEIVRGLAASP
ncbi:transcriptional regulator [Mobilicoccus pelagius]|uniref:transcriptional regulator n=1 Tax=Mobilicoccus pelagius TaxID=746032 RepID=UPI0002F7953D|nr:transcriptional regulator [Mobilicoccus pelagius]